MWMILDSLRQWPVFARPMARCRRVSLGREDRERMDGLTDVKGGGALIAPSFSTRGLQES
jgi:hypothetical protein